MFNTHACTVKPLWALVYTILSFDIEQVNIVRHNCELFYVVRCSTFSQLSQQLFCLFFLWPSGHCRQCSHLNVAMPKYKVQNSYQTNSLYRPPWSRTPCTFRQMQAPVNTLTSVRFLRRAA